MKGDNSYSPLLLETVAIYSEIDPKSCYVFTSNVVGSWVTSHTSHLKALFVSDVDGW